MRYLIIFAMLLTAPLAGAGEGPFRDLFDGRTAYRVKEDIGRSIGRAVSDRIRHNERANRSGSSSSRSSPKSDKVDVGDALTNIGINWVAGSVLGRQGNSLDHQHDFNRAKVNDWSSAGKSSRKINESWQKTYQREYHDQNDHGRDTSEGVLRAELKSYERYCDVLTKQGKIPPTFDMWKNQQRQAYAPPAPKQTPIQAVPDVQYNADPPSYPQMATTAPAPRKQYTFVKNGETFLREGSTISHLLPDGSWKPVARITKELPNGGFEVEEIK